MTRNWWRSFLNGVATLNPWGTPVKRPPQPPIADVLAGDAANVHADFMRAFIRQMQTVDGTSPYVVAQRLREEARREAVTRLAAEAVLPDGVVPVDGPERDARFHALNDAVWGAGNWVKCGICPVDREGNPPYHHKDAHS